MKMWGKVGAYGEGGGGGLFKRTALEALEANGRCYVFQEKRELRERYALKDGDRREGGGGYLYTWFSGRGGG